MLALALIGGNAAVIQVLGWGSMLVERSLRMDVVAAVVSTFDGSAPCHMCRAADALRREATPLLPALDAKLLKKAEAPARAAEPLLVGCAPGARLPPWPPASSPRDVSTTPELPPPRMLS